MRVVLRARLRGMIRSFVLAILVALSLVGFILTSWGKAEINNPESFSEGSSKALASPQVRSLLSQKITEEVWNRVDVKKEVTNLLPQDAEILAAPAEVALRAAFSSAVDKILEQEFIRSIWAESVRVTHNTALRSLQNRQSALLIEKESVSLNIATTLKITARKLGLPSVIQDNIPSGIGEVELAKTKTVAKVQTAYNILNVSPFLFVPPIVLFSLLLVFFERRSLWRAGVFLGSSLLLAGLTLLLLEATIPPFFLGTFENPLSAALAQYIWREWSADLLISVKVLLLLSLSLIGLSLLASPPLRPLYKKMASDWKTWAAGAKKEVKSKWNERDDQGEDRGKKPEPKKSGPRKPGPKKSTSAKKSGPKKSTAGKKPGPKRNTSAKKPATKTNTRAKKPTAKTSTGKKPITKNTTRAKKAASSPKSKGQPKRNSANRRKPSDN